MLTTNERERYDRQIMIKGFGEEGQEKLKRAKVIIAGGGVILSGGSKDLRELAEYAEVPVTMTLMGLGSFPGTHALSLGMLGMHGTYYANKAVQGADLLIAIGMRFDDRVTGKIDAFAGEDYRKGRQTVQNSAKRCCNG
jgi:thiamine pyrophosphate-dependent acetolactate synthase large subunit-like protein